MLLPPIVARNGRHQRLSIIVVVQLWLGLRLASIGAWLGCRDG